MTITPSKAQVEGALNDLGGKIQAGAGKLVGNKGDTAEHAVSRLG